MRAKISLFLSTLLLTVVAYANTATVTWTHPTQRVDSTPLALADIKETQVDWAKCTASNTFPTTVDGTKAVAAPATTTSIGPLAYGTWCFRARTADLAGRVSGNSNVVWKQYVAPPNPPVITTVAGLVWELKLHPVDGPYLARVVGTVAAGKPCLGLTPQIGFDLFAVGRESVVLDKRARPSGMLVAQCAIG
jgi:hypothetical protein